MGFLGSTLTIEQSFRAPRFRKGILQFRALRRRSNHEGVLLTEGTISIFARKQSLKIR